jgi:hypothetical protein
MRFFTRLRCDPASFSTNPCRVGLRAAIALALPLCAFAQLLGSRLRTRAKQASQFLEIDTRKVDAAFCGVVRTTNST